MRRRAAASSKLDGVYLSLAVGVVCISLSAIFVKLAGVPGPASAFYRVFIAALLLVPLWVSRRPASMPRRAVLAALAGGVFFGLDIVLWNVSLLMTSAANATLLANNAPLWVSLGALLLFRERLPRLFWFGMVTAMVGAAMILGEDVLQHPTLGRGDVMALTASAFYAAYLLTTQQARATLSTLTVLSLSLTTSTVLLFTLALAFRTPLAGYSAQTWAALVGLGLISQVGGWLAINYTMGRMPASVVSVALLGQPVLTAVLAILFLGERLSAPQVLGGFLVLSGIYVVISGHRDGVTVTIDNGTASKGGMRRLFGRRGAA